MKCRAESAKIDEKHEFTFAYLTFVDNFTVYTAAIFQKFAEIDGFPERMIEYNKKTGGKSKELDEQAQKCISHTSTSIAVFRPDLSYLPEEPAFTPDFSKPFFNKVYVYYIKPDKLEQAVEVAKKLKAMHEQKGTSMAYRMYERICGDGLPVLALLMSAENEVQLIDVGKKTMEKLGEDYTDLLKENVGVLSRIETIERTYIPGASYVPEGTFEVAVSGCAQDSQKVLLFMRDGSLDLEFMLTKEVGVMKEALEQSGFKVDVATLTGEPISTGSIRMKPLKLGDVAVADYAGFILPCMASEDSPGTPIAAEAVAMVKNAAAAGKPVAAQLGSVRILAKAGLLRGTKYASVPVLRFNERPDFEGSIYAGNGIVQDGNIITSGVCPYMARRSGLKDGTEELIRALIDAIKVKKQ
jgi:protease I